MLPTSKTSKQEFLQKAQQARQIRQEEKAREKAAVTIQAVVRKFLCNVKLKKSIRYEFDSTLLCHSAGKKEIAKGLAALEIFKVTQRFFFLYDGKNSEDNQRLQTLCEVILYNLEVENNPKFWYMSVMMFKDLTVLWIKQLKKILDACCKRLKVLRVQLQSEAVEAEVYLSMIALFTDCTDWKILQIKGGENIKPAMKQLCSTVLSELCSKGLYASLSSFLHTALIKAEVDLKPSLLSSLVSLATRPLIQNNFHTSTVVVFILNILAVPGLILHCQRLTPESMEVFEEQKVAFHVLQLLSDPQNMKIVFNSLEGNKAVCFLGNLVSLFAVETELLKKEKGAFLDVTISILNHCQSYVSKKHSNLTKWHPLLGWFKQTSDSSALNDGMCHVTNQLKLLWKQPLINVIFSTLPENSEAAGTSANPQQKTSEKSFLKRAFSKSGFKSLKSWSFETSDPVVANVCRSCELYRTLINTFSQVKIEIMAGISLQETLIVRLWRFLYSLGPDDGLKAVLNYLTTGNKELPSPLNALLILFCECCAQLIPIIDENEIYQLQKPFSCDDLVNLSSFLNSLVFRLVWNDKGKENDKERPNVKSAGVQAGAELLQASLLLLMVLYDRDSRRPFSSQNLWVIKELKLGYFRVELDAERKRALVILQKIPHVLPFGERVRIFHEWIDADKENYGICKESSRANALITVRRRRVLEDGYQQLSSLKGQDLKGLIRVKFINEQGLDEAGIDQDGVFKEFLEDTIKQAFDPQLNLFKVTSGGDERLYPSTTSFIHENYLQLFEFVGKMLGKAVYEGILVEVPFASFFLSQILNRQHSMLYSSIDELPSLDPDMAKSLNFIKNYDGDVEELELSFSFDEDVLGKVVTHDLKPGGRAIKVNNSNKLTYVHLMAHFRLYTHIKEQTIAFVRGFRSVISPEWLSLFSTPELQRLISGDTGDIDLDDLKRNCRYYGGYHPGHHVIVWLWDIVQNDFDRKEKGMFLKFVTSCSRPPLLGFKYLEPPFSIRYVECADDEDWGDTFGSVMRGFLNIRRCGRETVGRLPTASTCFNLLKLPSYRKKATLRDKLRYSVASGAGFELS